MKKILGIISVLLLLVGCSNEAVTMISDKDEVLFMIEDTPVTKGNVYNMLRFQNIGQYIIGDAQTKLIESKIELTDDLKEQAQSTLENAKEQLGEYFTYYYGNKTDEELLADTFYPAAMQLEFIDKYYDENVDSILKDIDIVKVNILYYDDEETAKNASTALNNGATIAEVIEEFGSSNAAGTNKENPTVVDKNTLPKMIADFVASDEGQLKNFSKSPLNGTNQNTFYLVKLIDDNKENLKEEFKDSYLASSDTALSILSAAFNKEKFEVYDQAIYNGIMVDTDLSDFHPQN